ncbi:hypothetical protein DFR29_107277 [Tahibacter aquaticus]|jgi:hypothetical protein|uniref:DUF2304 domain-containing protein n=1 Tax=Tahibacter aquaticus TaxID=520092 RepID=A0A4R6YWQ4_9GAMM|nr:DUF2304 domain-containing protein [Tahibacter aquaticus]TDR43264.1 hypothetical protein DFR29_107277 [Tahibacter aquaticus]
MNAQITAALIGLALAGSILYLVRRDHLHGPYALWWLIVAAATLVLGFVPRTIDWLAHLSGIAYPPVLPIIVGVSLILLRLLQLDIERSRQERQIRRLNQKLAILEEELTTLRRAVEQRSTSPRPQA